MIKIGFAGKALASDVSLLVSSNLASAGARFFAVGLLAAILSVENLGRFLLLFTVVELVSNLCEFGLSRAYVTFSTQDASVDRRRLFGRLLKIKLVISALAALIMINLRSVFFDVLHFEPELSGLYIWAVGFGVLLSFHNQFTSVFQARREFSRFALLFASVNLLRLALISIGSAFGIRNLTWLFGLFLFPIFISAMASAILAFGKLKTENSIGESIGARKVIKFAAPLGGVNILAIVLQRIELYLTTIFGSVTMAGIFGLAQQAAFIVPLVTTALVNALLPRVTEMNDAERLRDYRRKLLRVYPLILAATLFMAFLAPYPLELLFGDKYAAAGTTLSILVFSFGLHAIFNPLTLVLYNRQQTYWITLIHAVQLPVLVACCVILVPLWGAPGAAVSGLIIRIGGVTAILFLTGRLLRSTDHGNESDHSESWQP